MKHKIVLTCLMAATLAGAIMLPELLGKTPSDEVTDTTVTVVEDDVELPVEVLIPIVAYEDAVGDPLLSESLTLAQVAQQATALRMSETVSSPIDTASVSDTLSATTSSVSTTQTVSDNY